VFRKLTTTGQHARHNLGIGSHLRGMYLPHWRQTPRVRRLTKGTDHGPFRDGQAREALTRAKAGSCVDGDCRCAGRGRRRVGGWAAQLGSPARLGGVGIVEALLTWVAATAFNQLAAGPSAIMHQALSGIPVKVYARAAGEHTVGLWNLAGWTLLERGLRISMVGLGV
jgi:hypothetical protein